MTISIRALSDADLEAADAVLSSAFQRPESWLTELRLFHRLQPDGIFLACQHGTPAGMVATILYSDYAYVGLMGIHQDFQRQGLGLALMEHVLAWARAQNVPLIKLDASQAGQPLYEKLGFVPFEEVYVFQKQPGGSNWRRPSSARFVTSQDLDPIIASDTPAFGADRGRLLHALLEIYPERAFMLQNEQGGIEGYLFAQAKRIGPWVMPASENAELLLLAALSLPFNGPVSVVTPANNTVAASLFQRYGFQISRVNCHMAYGSGAPTGQRDKVFGQTSLSFG